MHHRERMMSWSIWTTLLNEEKNQRGNPEGVSYLFSQALWACCKSFGNAAYMRIVLEKMSVAGVLEASSVNPKAASLKGALKLVRKGDIYAYLKRNHEQLEAERAGEKQEKKKAEGEGEEGSHKPSYKLVVYDALPGERYRRVVRVPI